MARFGTWLLAVLLGLACRPAEPPADLLPIEHPDLSSIEDAARQQLEEQRAKIDREVDRGAERTRLAGVFGDMGELYHAYDLLEAAAACYRNAEKLDPESFLWPYYLGALQQMDGDLEGAAESLGRALEIRSDDLPTLKRLGEVRLGLGDAAAAREHFQALLADDAYAAAGYFGLGRAAAALGDAGQAVSHFERTLELQGDAGIVHHPLGLALSSLDRSEEAQEHLEMKGSGQVTAPDRLMERLRSLAVSAGAYLKRGNQAMMQGRLGEAEAELRSAIEADPEAVAAYRNLAIVLRRQGDAEGAIEVLRTAMAIAPRDVWVHVDLGNACLSKGLATAAVEAFEKAVEIDPELTQARFNLANALIPLERWADAKPHLEATLRLEPEHSRARYQLALAKHRTGDSPTAVAELRALLAEEPELTAARMGLASILVDTRRGREAIELYRQGLQLDLPKSEQIELLNALANLTWRNGQRRPAIGYWQQAADLDPTSSEAWANLANVLQVIGDKEKALELFTKAVELDPKNSTAWLSEARLLILDHDFSTAAERLEAALAEHPDHAGLNDTLARLLATCPINEIRDGSRAMVLARKAYALESSIAHADTFGMALAEVGNFEEAIRWQRSVINEAARRNDQKALPGLVANLRRYEKRQPIRIAK